MMLYVCERHVITGVKEIEAPHVLQISNLNGKGCLFCNQKARYKVFEIFDIEPTSCYRLNGQTMYQSANETKLTNVS